MSVLGFIDFYAPRVRDVLKGGGGHSSSSGGRGSSGSSPEEPSSSSGSKGRPSSSSSSKGKPSHSFSLGSKSSSSKSGVSASSYSSGGGSRIVLSSSSPFSGRYAGGGNRGSVYGTWIYGSGYPYGAYGDYVGGRPFPYYFWPVCPGGYYLGDTEYCPSHQNATDRPGGNLTTALIQAPFINETYRILGDNSSVTAMIDALVANCSITNTSTVNFVPDNVTYPLPEQILQYYRASSFALSLDSYNNSAASYAGIPSSNSSSPILVNASTPLSGNLNMTFLTCINDTIGAALPLVSPEGHGLTAAEIGGIVAGSIVFVVLLFLCCVCCWPSGGCCHRRRKSAKDFEGYNPEY